MLSPDQQIAADDFLDFLRDPDERFMVLEGHSGTGKSFLTSHLLKLAKTQCELLKTLMSEAEELNFAITATTNKAAKVIGEATGHDAQTIHSYLELKVFNDFNNGKTTLKKTSNFQVKENTLVLIDEGSMIDRVLFDMINESTCKCKILIIGDPYQLTPVFEKNCPAFAKGFRTAKLTTIQRQAAGNPIIALGDRLRSTVETGKFFDLPVDGQNIIHIPSDQGDVYEKMINDAFLNQTDVDDNRVLAWSNVKVNQYNAHIRGLFTQSEEPEIGECLVANSIVKSLNGNGMIAISNDQKIIVRSFEDYVFEEIDGWAITTEDYARVFMARDHKEVDSLLKIHKRAKDWPMFYLIKESVADLRPVFASTVHKSQGSTYKTVFIDLADIGRCNIWQDVARMLYVAITRASVKVVLYGELPAKYRGG